jgi:hypothetical protein
VACFKVLKVGVSLRFGVEVETYALACQFSIVRTYQRLALTLQPTEFGVGQVMAFVRGSKRGSVDGHGAVVLPPNRVVRKLHARKRTTAREKYCRCRSNDRSPSAPTRALPPDVVPSDLIHDMYPSLREATPIKRRP